MFAKSFIELSISAIRNNTHNKAQLIDIVYGDYPVVMQ